MELFVKTGFKSVCRFGDCAICLIEIRFRRSKEDFNHKYARYTDKFYIKSIVNTENGKKLESVFAITSVGSNFLYEVGKCYNARTYFYPESIKIAKKLALRFYPESGKIAKKLALRFGEWEKSVQIKSLERLKNYNVFKFFENPALNDEDITEFNKVLSKEMPNRKVSERQISQRNFSKIDDFILKGLEDEF